jgi:hypothetical protein
MPSQNYTMPSTKQRNRRYRVNVCEGSVHVTQEDDVGKGRWVPCGQAGTLGEMNRDDAKKLAELILHGLASNF